MSSHYCCKICGSFGYDCNCAPSEPKRRAEPVLTHIGLGGMRKHGELVHPGDEFNKDDMFYCAVCDSVHTRGYSGCFGLAIRVPRITKTNHNTWTCSSSLFDGTGRTPTAAYRAWASELINKNHRRY